MFAVLFFVYVFLFVVFCHQRATYNNSAGAGADVIVKGMLDLCTGCEMMYIELIACFLMFLFFYVLCNVIFIFVVF